MPDLIRAGLKPNLPDRYAGTLAADLDIKTIARPGSATTDAVVSVYAQSRTGTRKLKRLDAGLLTHPVFGNREVWRTQEGAGQGVEPGWFTGPAEDAAPRVRAGLERALKDVAAKAVQREPESESNNRRPGLRVRRPRKAPTHEALWIEHVYKRNYGQLAG